MRQSLVLKIFAIALIAAMLVPTVAVAQTPAPAAFDWQQEKGKTISLIMPKHAYTDSVVPLFPEFEKLTGITVKYDVLSEEQFFEKLLIDLSTQAGTYDIFMTGPVTNWKYAPAGWIEPLDDYINNPKLTAPDWDFADFFPSLISASRWDKTPGSGVGKGPLWALPVNEEGYALFYRKDLFAAKNIEVPKTWDELYQTAKSLNGTEWDGKTLSGFVARGNRSWPTINAGYGSMFWTYGGKDFDANFNCQINNEIGVQVTDLWAKLMQDAAPKDVINYTWYEAQDNFNAGKSAMFIDADHMAQAFEAKGSPVAGKVGYAPPPSGPNGEPPRTSLWMWSTAMSAASKNKNAAWLWLQWAASKDILTRSAVAGNINPCRISVANSPEVAAYMKDWGDYQKTYIMLMDKVVALNWAPMKEMSQIGDRWAVAVQEVILGSKSSKDALDAAAADINAIVKKAGYVK